MFLHSGAAMHRHEYSPPVEQNRRNSLPLRYPLSSPLARSAFSNNSIPRKTSTNSSSSNTLTFSTQQSSRPISEVLPRKLDASVRFQEPDWDTMSDDGRSIANSEESSTTASGSRRRRRASRTGTSFHIALPAPTLTRKNKLAHLRPKLLLQLQRLSPDARPKPAIDVLTSTVIIPKLAKKFPRMFRGKTQLGANDVMVMRSEDYDTPDHKLLDDTDSDDESLSVRELMAVICQMRKDGGGSQGKAEIVLGDGSVYVATPQLSGIYEFVTVDKHGIKTTARWVRKVVRSSTGNGSEFKFTFSIINPSTRRHPIMASLTQNNLEIMDHYTSISASSGRYPPTSPISVDIESPIPGEIGNERVIETVGDDLKTLIQVTGVWVALREGLSPYFRYSDAMTPISATSSPRNLSGGRPPSLSLSTDNRPNLSVRSATPDSAHCSVGDVFRRSHVKAGPNSTPSPSHENMPLKRAASAGPAFMQRVSARRSGIAPSVVNSDSEGEVILSAEPVNRRSMPPALSIQNSPPIFETPTKPQSRVQSMYLPAPVEKVNVPVAKELFVTPTVTPLSDYGERVKLSKWKAFTHLFRRSNSRRE